MFKSILAAVILALPIVFALATTDQLKPVEFFAANTTKNCSGKLSPYQWIFSTVHLPLPKNAVKGGYDENKKAIYVGRAFHDGTYWPASIVPAKHTAYITANGKSYIKETFEVLTGDNFSWEMGYDGRVPNGAISTTPDYWIGRATYKRAVIVGKVSRKQKTCLISFENKEKKNDKYEVLVYHGPYICKCKY